jgi:very-short-patch-repair endonuclease
MTPVCRFCGLTSTIGRRTVCYTCFDLKPLCRCGCGAKVFSVRERGYIGKSLSKFLSGHNGVFQAETWQQPEVRHRRLLGLRRSRQPNSLYWVGWKKTRKSRAKAKAEMTRRSWLDPKIREARLSNAKLSPNSTEQKMIEILNALGLRYEFQGTVQGLTYVPDFVLERYKLVIEVDGYHHTLPTGRKRDRIKNRAYKRAGYAVLHFPHWDLFRNQDSVEMTILSSRRLA